MVDFTFCANRECKAMECARHHSHAPVGENVSWAMLECFYEHMDSYDGYARVVRCKDCKNWMYEYDDVGLCVTDVPDIDGVQRLAQDFCSYGERRTDG